MSGVGPDIALVGAARSGTSFLAAALAEHPQVDPGAVKEPNYFSRALDRGESWYDGQFEARTPGLLRLDASMSYTFRHFPDALARLSETAPDAIVVYVVRNPFDRLVSHHQLHRDYFHNDPSTTLGEALAGPSGHIYLGAGDYDHWLRVIDDHFSAERVVVIPFAAVTKSDSGLRAVAELAGLDAGPLDDARSKASAHQNNVVSFRHPAFKWLRQSVRRRGWYPRLRRMVGSDNLRRARGMMTRSTPKDSVAEALETCSPEQLVDLRARYERARLAVAVRLSEQDGRRGTDWAALWEAETPPLDPAPRDPRPAAAEDSG